MPSRRDGEGAEGHDKGLGFGRSQALPLATRKSELPAYGLIADSTTYGNVLAVAQDVTNDHTAIAAKAGSLAMTPAPITVVVAIISGADVYTTSSDINVDALRTC